MRRYVIGGIVIAGLFITGLSLFNSASVKIEAHKQNQLSQLNELK